MTNKIGNIVTVTVLAITTSAIIGILVSTNTQQSSYCPISKLYGFRDTPTLLQTIQSKAPCDYKHLFAKDD